MMFGQLTSCESLRDICLCLNVFKDLHKPSEGNRPLTVLYQIGVYSVATVDDIAAQSVITLQSEVDSLPDGALGHHFRVLCLQPGLEAHQDGDGDFHAELATLCAAANAAAPTAFACPHLTRCQVQH